ncbi:GNAT family N-acetyltransferase [Desulfofustis glycolicus]|uniref:Acetyltransferase (GNAT) family protein n=1 Tax=Desulfofustis glycolicus DSM 9705 TaxID=1121409 RepID=A0A1M5YRA8_9BACT|nr:GNAT family N-acetyltransferase [Desulfofustis glycolicus]MCB2218712.1 GNAT family N-acetyltransferase [Desulfobulbaceae bacterium]SHI14572.1 Acetyltransferase (GNAT) family protein [Desulfofustis glycolicus DSM 9705]
MQRIEIKKVSQDNIGQLQEICRSTFAEAFSDDNSEENIADYLANGFSVEKLTDELNDPNSQFYFALIDDQAIGYLKVNSGASQTEIRDSHSLEIERIYVLKAYHGKNVGKLLYEKALEISKQNEIEYIWLGVWEKNPRALRFYKKIGFQEFGKHIFILGNEKQTDIMMKLHLNY